MMEAIVAVDLAWGIGCQDELLFRIKSDLKRFKEMTIGQVVILGRKTLQTFPGGRPLPGRVNIVLSRNPNLNVEGAIVCHSREDVQAVLKDYPDKKAFVIGGSSIYNEFLPECHRVYVTVFHASKQADAFFPNLDQLPDWHCVQSDPELEEDGLVFNYRVYEQTPVK